MSVRRNIVFRADGNHEVGLGHLVRCVALAQAFQARGHRCKFAGETPDFLKDSIPGGEPIRVTHGAAAWDEATFQKAVSAAALLVTDDYRIDAQWQTQSPAPVLAITDPPLRDQHCEILLTPTMFDGAPEHALTAPSHCLLRSDIVARRKGPKDGKRILVNCGGGKDADLTQRVAEAIAADPVLSDLPVTIVLGQGVAAAALAATIRGGRNIRILQDVRDMGEMIDGHDLAVGAPGGGALERACLGLPQVLIPIAENQMGLARGLERAGAAAILAPDVTCDGIGAALRRLIDDEEARRGMAQTAFDLIDGKGAERVVDAVEKRIFHA